MLHEFSLNCVFSIQNPVLTSFSSPHFFNTLFNTISSLSCQGLSLGVTLLLFTQQPKDSHGTRSVRNQPKRLFGCKEPFQQDLACLHIPTNVQTLDLAWLTRDLAIPLIDSFPPALFPAATSVRLAGVMPYALAASILLTNTQKLLHLDLDNLQQSGITSSIHVDENPKIHYGYPSVGRYD